MATEASSFRRGERDADAYVGVCIRGQIATGTRRKPGRDGAVTRRVRQLRRLKGAQRTEVVGPAAGEPAEQLSAEHVRDHLVHAARPWWDAALVLRAVPVNPTALKREPRGGL